MGLLLDSSAVLLLDGPPGKRTGAFWKRAGSEEFYLSIVTADELLRVASVAKTGERARRTAFVEALLDKVPVIPIERTTVRIHAALRPEWEKTGAGKGHRLGWQESWIAATCLAHGLVLLTAQASEFQGIRGLRVETVK